MKNTTLIFLLFTFSLNTIFAQNVNIQKYRLGQSYEENGMLKEAELLFEELVKSEPSNNDYLMAYVGVMKKQNKFSDMTNLVEKYYVTSKTLESSNLMAELYWRTGKTEEANKLWDDAINIDKYSFAAYSLVSQTQIELRLFDKAINTLNIGRKVLKDKNLFSDVLIKLYISTNDFHNGFDEILSALKNNFDIATAQGRIYALMVNDNAIDYISQGLSKFADDNSNTATIQEFYVWFLRTTRRLDEALKISQRIDELKQTNGYDLLNFAATSARDGQLDIAIKAYDLIIAKGKNSPYFSSAIYGYTRTLDEKILLDTSKPTVDDFEQIIKRYRNIIEEFPKTGQAADSRIRIASIYGDEFANKQKAIDELTLLTKEFPNTNQSISAYLLLAKYEMMEGRIDVSKQWLRKVIDNSRITSPNQKDEASYLLALNEYYSGNIAEAKLRLIEISLKTGVNSANDALIKLAFLEENKSFVEPLNKYIQAEFLEYREMNNDAIEIFEEVSKLAEKSSLGEASLFEIAQIYFAQKEYSNSRTYLNRLLQEYPNTIKGDQILFMTAESFYYDKNEADALKFYTELLIKYPESIFLNDSRKKIRLIRKEKS